MRLINKPALMCFAAACMPFAAHASLIDGSQLHISGDALLGTTSVTWQCNQGSDSVCPVANHGDFGVSSSNGSFAQYNGTFGLIANINDSTQPLNAPFSLPSFITFDLNNDISVELTFIPLGNDTLSNDCSGLPHCTPTNTLVTPNNPGGITDYNLDHNALGTVLTFGVIGTVHEVGGSTADISGIFTAGFNGLSTAQTLTAISTGSVRTYSGDFTLTNVTQAGTPEPASILLSGLGLAALGLASRRVRRS